MKRVLFYLFAIIPFTLQAQNIEVGVYETYSDFKSDNLSIVGDSTVGLNAVRISDFLLRPYIYIKTAQGTMKIHQDSVYAVKTYDGIYRFFSNQAYLLEENDAISIYSKQNSVTEYTISGPVRRSKKVIKQTYYFSTDGMRLKPLTLANITQSFFVDKQKEKSLYNTFENNEALLTRQSNSSRFVINGFLKEVCNNAQ